MFRIHFRRNSELIVISILDSLLSVHILKAAYSAQIDKFGVTE